MIYGLFGRPRAGKSYEAVRYHIIDAAKKGRLVVTNIPINIEHVRAVYGEETAKLIIVVKTDFGDYGAIRPFSTPTDFTQYEWKNEDGQGPLFVVDECHLSLGRDAKKDILEYMSLHGHYGHDIILLTQNPRKINRDIKDMIEISWRCIKNSIYGEDDGYTRKTYHGVSTSNADFMDLEERKYDPAFFRFYQSHTLSSKSVNEASSKVKMEKYKGKKKIIAMLVIGLAICTNAMINAFGGDKEKPKKPIEEKPELVKVEQEKPKNDPEKEKLKAILREAIKSGAIDPSVIAENMQVAENVKKEEETYNQKLEKEIKNKSEEFHPFYKVQLHISGTMVSDIYHVDVSATQNGQHVFMTSDAELRRAGYTVEIYSKCSMKITYFEYEDFLTCDSPRISASPSKSIAAN